MELHDALRPALREQEDDGEPARGAVEADVTTETPKGDEEDKTGG